MNRLTKKGGLQGLLTKLVYCLARHKYSICMGVHLPRGGGVEGCGHDVVAAYILT